MIADDIEQTIELCLSRAGALDPAKPERDALVYEVVQLQRMAEIVSTPARKPEPINSHVFAVWNHDGVRFDDEVFDVLRRTFRKYDLCRRAGSSR